MLRKGERGWGKPKIEIDDTQFGARPVLLLFYDETDRSSVQAGSGEVGNERLTCRITPGAPQTLPSGSPNADVIER